MHFLLAFCTTAATLLTMVEALSQQKHLAENEPWHLTNVAVFTGFKGLRNSSIAFDLVDSNDGLQMDTICSRSVLGSVEDANNFYPCANKDLNFRWDGSTLRLQKYYKDTAIGPCPLYCTVTAYGNGTPDLTLTSYLAEDGKGETDPLYPTNSMNGIDNDPLGTRQDALDIFVTEMVT